MRRAIAIAGLVAVMGPGPGSRRRYGTRPRRVVARLAVQRAVRRQPRRHRVQHYNEMSQYDVACYQLSH
jgi:hypothetical protein